MSHLSISLFGLFKATLDQASVESFRTKSVQALFIYLVCEARRPHSREKLMALLWPGMPLESIQANLHRAFAFDRHFEQAGFQLWPRQDWRGMDEGGV